ncbi:MAG: hypothetical protein PHF67_03875, partial [Candidatus Nanoarchaeia archaeon]|nr:hypothetical protein [Candidatus Nanoarchaeia archaeon]
QSIKLNLSSSDYYDLYLKLDDIKDNKAKITIQTIHEEIPKIGVEIKINDSEKEVEKPFIEGTDYRDTQIKTLKILFFAIVTIFIIIILLILLIKRKDRNSKLKEYKERFNNHLKPRK